MGGISLGGASFEINANAAGLIQAMAKAEAESKKSVAAISKAIDVAEKDVKRLATAYLREETKRANASAAATLKIIKSDNDRAEAAERAAKRIEAANARAAQVQQRSADAASASNAGLLKSVAGLAGGYLTLDAALQAAGDGLQFIAAETQKANQSSFGLTATYKTQASLFTQLAAQQSAITKRSVVEYQDAATAFGALNKNYAIGASQIQELVKRSADLAAVKGITVAQAAERLQSALRGEAEAAEFLGLTLNSDYLKKFADMTAEQRKNFETLDPLTKAQIAYKEALKQTDPFLGAAAKRADDNTGALGRMKKAQTDLAVSMGKNLQPELRATAQGVEKVVEWLDKAIEKYAEFKRRMEQGTIFAPAVVPFLPDQEIPSVADVVDDRDRRRREDADRRDRARAAHEAKAAADKKTAEAAIEAIEAERKAKERWYDEERARIEARRYYQLEDIETRRDAALAAIEAERDASKKASDAAIEQLEREKASRIAAAEEARDRVIGALDAQAKAYERNRETEDRQRQDALRDEDRQLATTRKNEDAYRELYQKNELRRLEDRHEKVLADLDSEQRALEKGSERHLRNLDRQADAARRASENVVRGIEAQSQAEDDRHRAAMQALDDEQDARLVVIDAQLKALEVAEKQADQSERMAGLQRKVTDTERALAQARGSGDAEALAAAREALTTAIRRNDQAGAVKARRDIEAAAGSGDPEAIRKLEEELADAHAAIEREKVDVTRDAERDKLKAAQDAIRDEIDARKQAEDDTTRARKRDLDAEKQNEQDKLAERLRALDKRKELTQDATKDEIEALGRRRQAEQRDYDDAVAGARRTFEAQSQILDDRREKEDQDRDDRRQKEDRERADRRRLEDEALEAQRKAATKTFEQERAEAEVHYNGPNGLITQAKKAAEAQILEYNKRLAVARKAFEDERKEAEKIYTNADKNGLLDMLDKARAKEIAELDDSKVRWQKWQEAISESIKKVLDDLEGYTSSINSQGGVGNKPYGPGDPTKHIPNPDDAAVERYIKDRSSIYRIPAEDALAVWNGEGRSAYVGDSGSSFGPYQLHIGGLAGGGNAGAGLGDQFMAETGLDPRDPKTWKQQIEWVFDYVRKNGWNGQWHGAPSKIANKKYDSGHLFNYPTYTYTPSTRELAMIAEKRPEMLVGGAATAAAQRFNELARHGGMARTASPTGGYQPNYARIGDTLSALRGDGGGTSYSETRTINVNGSGMDDIVRAIRRDDARHKALNAGRFRGPRG